jgi:hypothetical protein
VLDLGRADVEPPPVVETARDRRPLLVAGVVVAVLLGGLMLTSGNDPDGDDGERAAAESGEAEAATSTSATTSTNLRVRPSIVRRPTTTTIPPPIAPEPIGARLVVGRSDEVALIDINGNQTTTRSLPQLRVPQDQFPLQHDAMTRRGDQLVFQGADGIYVTGLLVVDEPRLLGEAVLFVPGLREREVWLVTAPPGHPPAVRRWRVDGTALTGIRPLPVDWMPVAEVEGGLVLRRADRFQIWDPATGAVSFTSDTSVNLLAAGGRTVAWQSYCDIPICSLHLTDTVTGADRPVHLGDVRVDYGRGAFSPNGRFLVVPGNRVGEGGSWYPGLVVVDLVSATARFASASGGQPLSGAITWAPDSRWAFMLAPEGDARARVTAYSPERDVFVELELPPDVRGSALVAY